MDYLKFFNYTNSYFNFLGSNNYIRDSDVSDLESIAYSSIAGNLTGRK